jgi:hypothetical protein
MSSLVRLTDINISQRRQSLAELLHRTLIRLHLFPLCVLRAALFFCMETQILQQNHLAAVCLVDRFLDLLAHAVAREHHALPQQLLELRHDGLQAILLVGLAVRPAQVRHEDDGLGAMVDGVFDGRQRAHDALVVGDVLGGVEGHIEVDADEDPLVGQVDVLNRELIGEGHFGYAGSAIDCDGGADCGSGTRIKVEQILQVNCGIERPIE